MGYCAASRFTIVKGLDNSYTFTIKQNDSFDPMVISASDTFTAKIIQLSDRTVALTKALTVEDAEEGKINLSLTSSEVDALEPAYGEEVDRSYAKATYKIAIQCNTVNNGNFVVTVDEVYVD